MEDTADGHKGKAGARHGASNIHVRGEATHFFIPRLSPHSCTAHIELLQNERGLWSWRPQNVNFLGFLVIVFLIEVAKMTDMLPL